jgi:hypothetical protein
MKKQARRDEPKSANGSTVESLAAINARHHFRV